LGFTQGYIYYFSDFFSEQERDFANRDYYKELDKNLYKQKLDKNFG